MTRWHGRSGVRSDAWFDETLVGRCDGPTIDLGCGPGRFVAALAARDEVVLGIDHSRHAVAAARRQGASVLCRSIFERLPGEGRWHHVLLIDGNIGIGGEPDRVVNRAAALADPLGVVHVEIDSDIDDVLCESVRIETDRYTGPWFPWARVGRSGIEEIGLRHGLAVRAVWSVAERTVAELVRT
ncbi:methyltransferase domain-containing protein [Gordonia sp. CPCC 206044]|uniref:methyltransferase domain-containing protein n=1 Tax=Gordonia sp. CPCC 206044 TaxID=3140793 RepID=UPI003AF3C94C